MLTHNFMLRDLTGSVVAVVVFAIVLFAPGYLAGYTLDLFDFRRSSCTSRAPLSVALSFCVSPIAAHLMGRVGGLTTVCWSFAACAVGCLLLLFWIGKRDIHVSVPRRGGLLLLGWTVAALLLLTDFQIGHRLFYSVVMADQSYRIAFTDAVLRTGIPPANPLYFAGNAAPMRYYYFWYILCAAVAKLGHVSARQAFIASSVWAGFGLLAAVRLYATLFFEWTKRQRWIAYGLLAITGADLLPAVGNALLQSSVNGDTEWWSVDPIDAWPDSLLWVPHHVASVLCCLFAFLLLWQLRRSSFTRNALGSIVVAGLACASAFGLSVYVALGFALLMAAWLLRSFVGKQNDRHRWLTYVAGAAAIGFTALLPFCYELLGHAPGSSTAHTSQPSSHIFVLSLRPMIDSGLVTGLPVFTYWRAAHPALLDQAVRATLLIPGLAMELGVYGAVLVLLALGKRRRTLPSSDARDAAFFLCAVGLAVSLCISSSIISNNDFGYRAVMLPQFFWTLLTAEVIASWWTPQAMPLLNPSSMQRRVVGSLLIMGAVGTLYWAVLLRLWLPLETLRAGSGYSQAADDAYQIRAAFETLNQRANKNAVIAFRDMDLNADRQGAEVMTPSEFVQRSFVMDADHQILNAEEKCATHFGGTPEACAAIKDATAKVYTGPSPSAEEVKRYCRNVGVQYLVLTPRDSVWAGTGWPTQLPIAAEQSRIRLYQCASM